MFWRKLLLNGVLDISNVKALKKLIYYGSTKAEISNPFGDNPVLAHVYDNTTGEGVIVCKNNMNSIPVEFTKNNPDLEKLYIKSNILNVSEELFDHFHGYLFMDSRSFSLDGSFSSNTQRYDNLFYKKQLDTVEIGTSFNKIGKGQFSFIIANNFILPEGIKELRQDAFYYAEIKNFYFPSTVTSVSDRTFSYCKFENLHVADLDAFSGMKCYTTIGNYWKPIKIYHNNEEVKKVVIPNGQTELTSQFGYSSINEVILPDSLTSIGNESFIGTSIKSITLPKNLTYIGNYAFDTCKGLTSIEIPDTVTHTGSNVFYDCVNLESVSMPKGLTTISSYLFAGCTKLKNFSLGEAVNKIGNYAFDDCTSMGNVDMDLKNVTTIYEGAFYNTSLKSVNITSNTTEIGSLAFKYCSGELTIDNNIISNGNTRAFREAHFSKISIGDTPTSIGASVFNGCQFLKTVEIGENVTVIDTDAFNGAPITNLTISSTHLDKIGHNAFNGSKFETVTFPGVSLLEGCHFTGAIRAIRFLGDVNKIDTSAGANVTDYEGLFYVDMSKSSVVPEVVDSVGFASGIIAVPNSLYEDWIADPKWGEISSRIKGFDNTHYFNVLGAPFITDTSYTWEEFIDKGLDMNLLYTKDGYVMSNSISYVTLNGEKVLATDLITGDYYDTSR